VLKRKQKPAPPYFSRDRRQLFLPVSLPLLRPPNIARSQNTSWGAPLPMKQRMKGGHR
jgi:hypothetical protein